MIKSKWQIALSFILSVITGGLALIAATGRAIASSPFLKSYSQLYGFLGARTQKRYPLLKKITRYCSAAAGYWSWHLLGTRRMAVLGILVWLGAGAICLVTRVVFSDVLRAEGAYQNSLPDVSRLLGAQMRVTPLFTSDDGGVYLQINTE